MTRSLYVALGNSDKPYICPLCKFDDFSKEIDSLKATIQTLSDEIKTLKSKASSFGKKQVSHPTNHNLSS